jgi:hypothetical protein
VVFTDEIEVAPDYRSPRLARYLLDCYLSRGTVSRHSSVRQFHAPSVAPKGSDGREQSMNETEQNRTISWIVTITIGLLVALLVGAVFGFLGAGHHFRKESRMHMNRNNMGGAGEAGSGQQYVAALSYDATTQNCTQKINGNLDTLPHLSIKNGDTIEWSPRDAVTNVTFGNTAPNGPFDSKTYRGTAGYVGPSQDAQLGDNFFTSVVVDGHQCKNSQNMGVHVDN